MLKLLSNLKKSFWSVLIIVILLCIQAKTDLALPDYTSKIVNTGIQFGGIETSVPNIISQQDMEDLLLFVEDDSKILEHYELLKEKQTEEKKNIINKYFGKDFKVEEDKIYVLKNQEENNDELSKNISTALMELTTVREETTASQIKEKLITSMNEMQNINEIQKQYIKETPLIEIMRKMPKEQRNQVVGQFEEQISKMSESIKKQAAITSVKQIYKSTGIDTDKLQNNYIFIVGIEMLGVALISMISAVLIIFFSARVAAKLGKNLREKIFTKVMKFTRKELNEFSTASLITRSTNDVQQIQQLLTMLFRVLVYAPIIGIGGLIKVYTSSDHSLAWIIGLAIGSVLFVVGMLFIFTMPKFKKLQDLIDKINLVAREILTGLPVIRAFNKEKSEEKRFDTANEDLMKVSLFINKAMSMMIPLIILIMNIMTVIVIWYGGKGVDQGNLQVGDMMAFLQYMMQIVTAFLMISIVSIILPRASVSAKRINEVLETEPSVKDIENPKQFDNNKKGLVEFKNVSFKYPDADAEILEDINFTAEPGKITAIIGSTGSGKSTIVNLIPRFYDVTNGELLIDGINVKEVSQKVLRDIIGFVPQKGVLFSGTIESNIKYSDENMSEEKMKEAARIAQATEFIEGKENKYKDPIAQGGTNISGGQKQRLSIARAIAKDPEIYVFDDSFSALDFKTDAKLREELEKVTQNKTVIIVAQRISTILNADKIIVLEEGKVVGIGNHEQLMKDNETYRQIALSQLSEEELTSDSKRKEEE